jgi:sugar-specific transcriptional regulator TrmB
MYQDIYKSIGLTPKEGLVYEALLKLGETSIKPLLRETALKRGNLYDILYALEKQGLCELTHIDKKTKFRPTSPLNLKEIAETERERVEKANRELSGILPKLDQIFQLNSAKPFVAYYQGLGGIKKIHKLILEKKKPLKIFASFVDRNNQTLRELIEKQAHKQKLLNLPHQAIVPGNHYVTNPEKQTEQKKNNIQIKKLDNFELPSQIVIFGNSVAISSLTEPIITTYMENASISKTLNIIFDKLWDRAATLD